MLPALLNGQRVFNEVMRGIPFILGGQDVVRSNFQGTPKSPSVSYGSVYRSQRARGRLFHFFISYEVNECITEHRRQKRNTSEMASVVPRTMLNSFVTEDVLDSMSSAFNGASSVIVPRFGVQVAVLEHTPARSPNKKRTSLKDIQSGVMAWMMTL